MDAVKLYNLHYRVTQELRREAQDTQDPAERAKLTRRATLARRLGDNVLRVLQNNGLCIGTSLNLESMAEMFGTTRDMIEREDLPYIADRFGIPGIRYERVDTKQ